MKSFDQEKKLEKIFQKNVSVPKVVEDRMNETFTQLEEKDRISFQQKSPTFFFSCYPRRITAAAVGLILILTFCFSTPAVASKLPVIGSLFSQLQVPCFSCPLSF